MENITNALSIEHQNILKVIDLVLNECAELNDGKEPKKVFFSEVINFIKNYADGYHHAKEEEILFKAMLQDQYGMHCNPIPVMLMEHDEGRNYVKGMENALLSGNKEELIENAKGYCFLLQQHIHKEDNILYPMAEDSVNELLKQEVIKQYNSVSLKDYFPEDINEFIGKLNAIAEK